MKIRLWNLYTLFFKIGAILIGGGYVILPILKNELIEKQNLITEKELIEYYAISQSLPGLIAINTSIFIGYKLNGKLGALITVLGLITTPFLCIILLSSILNQIINLSFIQSILWGINFGVIILVIASVKEIWDKAIINKSSFFLFIIYAILILYMNINPAIIILISVINGILCKRFFPIGDEK